jgi:hypothetical protein
MNISVKNLDSKRRHRITLYADAEVKIVAGNGLRAFEQAECVGV